MLGSPRPQVIPVRGGHRPRTAWDTARDRPGGKGGSDALPPLGTKAAGHRLQRRDLVSESPSDVRQRFPRDEDRTEGLVTAMRRLLRREEVLATVPSLHGADPSRLISCSTGIGAKRTPLRGPETGPEEALPCDEPGKRRETRGRGDRRPAITPGAIRAGWERFRARKRSTW